MDVKRLCNNDGKGFYPTPKDLATHMLDKINFKYVYSVLEPSAGKGDLVMEIFDRMNKCHKESESSDWRIDAIEVDPYLRSILTHRFTDDGMREYAPKVFEEYEKMEEHMVHMVGSSLSEWQRYQGLKKRIQELNHAKNVRTVHDDFLTYRPQFSYDAIIMNPPFEHGTQHLLHAIKLTQHYGGQIVCLLNAETVLNPFSQERQDLKSKLDEYDADIEFLSQAFSNAERETDVRIAVIYIDIKREKAKSKIFDRLEKAQQVKIINDHDYAELISTDVIEAAIAMYNMEIKASLHLIDEYEAMSEWLSGKFNGTCGNMLRLCIMQDGQLCELGIESYIKNVRRKYWGALLNNEKFIGLLTSNLQSKYRHMIGELENYEFSRFNIERIQREMMAELIDGAKACIMELFDKLTVYHSYNDTVENGNVHYYNGWKTNKAYMLDKRCIIPSYSIWSQWGEHFDMNAIYALLSDMEKALNYLDGGITQPVDLKLTLKCALDTGKTRSIHFKYFDISLYKKGTVHITFRNEELLKRFNIYAAQNRGWLPPSYGKKKYNDMDSEEKSVIDSFQGKEDYAKVLAQPSKYFFSEKQVLSLLEQKEEKSA